MSMECFIPFVIEVVALNRLSFGYECIVGNRYRNAIDISGQVTLQKRNLWCLQTPEPGLHRLIRPYYMIEVA